MSSLRAVVGDLAELDRDIDITDITISSREVKPGGAFLACQGRATHGLAHAQEAIDRGASAILWEPAPGVEPPRVASNIVHLPIPRLREQLGLLADRYFAHPSEALTVVGITGTNGKTTTAWLAAQALRVCGRPAAYSGTLGLGVPGQLVSGAHTTPDAVSVQRQLAQLREAGIDAVAMEVSSHALDQGRVNGVRFHTAVFTNLTRDHLDYHGTMARYGAAKAYLFDWPTLALRLVNIDDPFGAALAQAEHAPGRLVTLSRQRQASVRATETRLTQRGIGLHVESEWGVGEVVAPLLGEFNADNALAVFALLLSWDIPFAQATAALAGCTAPPGRMEAFGGRDGAPLAIVDYAHTPDALEKALLAARAHCSGRLEVVFGCGGDRDSGKRPMMGEVAARLADRITLTDDNPRSEAPARIVEDIRRGIPASVSPRIEHDRTTAITAAVGEAREGDAVLIAGKGHEDYQIVGSERRAFSDQSVVRAALGSRA